MFVEDDQLVAKVSDFGIMASGVNGTLNCFHVHISIHLKLCDVLSHDWHSPERKGQGQKSVPSVLRITSPVRSETSETHIYNTIHDNQHDTNLFQERTRHETTRNYTAYLVFPS